MAIVLQGMQKTYALVALAVECDAVVVGGAAWDGHLEELLLFRGAFAGARLAAVLLCDRVALAKALRTSLVGLLHHSRADHAHRHLRACALAVVTHTR